MISVLALAAVGPLMFIGGGTDQDDIQKRFIQLAGGDGRAIVVVPWASDDPKGSGKAYVDYMKDLGAPGARFVLPTDDPAALAHARGVFFSGGDQARILAGMSPAWRQALSTAWKGGAVLGGTSAGAMVWGSHAILDGDPMDTAWYGEDPKHEGLRLGAGLAFAGDMVVDTHFSQRGRVPRLEYACARYPGAVGVGVDPQTCAIWAGGKLEVRGRGTVTVVHVPKQPRRLGTPLSLTGVRLDVLSAGDGALLP